MELRLNKTDDAEALSRFYIENFDHLHPWEPKKEGNFHSISSWQERLQQRKKRMRMGYLSISFLTTRIALVL